MSTHNPAIRLSIADMTCAGCVSSVEAALKNVRGVQQVAVNLAERTAQVVGDVDPEHLAKASTAAGYKAAVMRGRADEAEKEAVEQDQYQQLWRRVWVAGIPGALLFISGMILGILPEISGWGRGFWFAVGIMTLGIMIYSGGHFFSGAWQQLKRRNSNMDTLIALGTGTAWVYSMLVVLFPDTVPSLARHAYFEAAIIIIALVGLGNALEMRARGKTSAAIKSLLQLQPPVVRVVRNGAELDLPLEEVGLEETLRVRAGETVPLDGVVLEGESHIDESMLTGESVPLRKGKDDRVTGGTLNGSGSFLMQVSHIGADTVLSQIIASVRQAQSAKPAIARLVDKVASVFVPVVVVIALLTFVLWYWFGPEPSLGYALVTAMTVLVIACPCALGLATPISIIAGVGKAAQAGILIRNGDALQQAAKLDTIVLDKTGTITQGKPTVNAIHVLDKTDTSDDTYLQIAASLEQGSEHPLANAIRAAANRRELQDLPVEQFEVLAGYGLQAELDGQHWLLGNVRLMERENLALNEWQAALDTLDQSGQTPVFLADGQKIRALFGIADAVKEDAKQSIDALKQQGLNVAMLTGDRRQVAEHIARQVGIETLHAEVLLADKSAVIAQLQAQGHTVAMVGDGINDAIALAVADIGIAMDCGADVSRDAADVCLVGNTLERLTWAISMAKAARRTVVRNLVWAVAYNVIGIGFAVTGNLNPIVAAIAMVGSSLFVLTSSLRLMAVADGVSGNTATNQDSGLDYAAIGVSDEVAMPTLSSAMK